MISNSSNRIFILALVIICSVLNACSDQPARAKFPGPAGRTTDLQQAQSQKAVMGGEDSFSKSLQTDGSDKKTLSGVIRLGKTIRLPEKYVVFIAVRRPEGGRPLAALRIPMAKFPYAFSISEENALVPGTPFEGDVVLSAAIDQDSDPISKTPGDSAGFLSTQIGQKDLNLVVDQSY